MGKVIIVGATSGIGYELAKLFATNGWDVGIAGRRLDKLESIQQKTPNICHYQQIDVIKDEAPNLLNKLIEKMGGMDLYVHSSGVGFQNPTLDLNLDNSTTKTNVYGFTQLVNTAFNYFRTEGKSGQIAIISSVAGTKGIGVAATYSATKRYQNTYIDALDQLSKSKKLGIAFTDIKPGFVKTDLLKEESNYPLIMTPSYASRIIYKAILTKRRRIIVNWKFKILIRLWRILPNFIWRRLKLSV